MTQLKTIALAAAAALCLAGTAGAATYLGSASGNDPFPGALDGTFGTTLVQSDALAKCDAGWSLDATCSVWEDGGAIGDYDSAFSLTYTDTGSGLNGQGFDWSFNPSAVSGATPVLFPHFVAVKAGNDHYVYELDASERLGGSIDYGALGVRQGISHVSFYNSEVNPVPLPAAAWFLIAGVGGLAAMRRKKG